MDYKRYRRHESHHGIGACRCCCILIVSLIFLLAITALVLFLILKPTKPDFSLQDVHVISFQVEQPPPQSSSGLEVFLSMNLELTLAVRNPNKVGIRYSTTRIFIYYRGHLVGLAQVPAFYQPAHSGSTIQATLVVSRVNLLDSEASDLLQEAMNGIVKLSLRGKVPAQVKILGVVTPRIRVGIACQIVVNPRQEQLVSKQCGVKNVDFH